MSKRFRSGAFALLDRTFKAEAIYKTLKRTTYRGKPTRKYRRYPELDGSFSLEAETALHSLLNTGRNKLVE